MSSSNSAVSCGVFGDDYLRTDCGRDVWEKVMDPTYDDGMEEYMRKRFSVFLPRVSTTPDPIRSSTSFTITIFCAA
jgi:hypothetical protein